SVRIRDHDELARRDRHATVHVRSETEWLLVFQQPRAGRQMQLHGQVRDHDELVDLRSERCEATVEVRMRPMGDDDAGDAHRSSWYTASVRRAVSDQLKWPARSSPARTSRSRSAIARSIPPASAEGSPGGTRIAAWPATSGIEPVAAATTGVPEAIASTIGRPKPS